ncbi:MAG: hypothetical protein DMF84_01055 [Acidobacteria bacterium]|nr:MAG: hypothetical protein DMF84_01055 [Acidobacteriota bacterium]
MAARYRSNSSSNAVSEPSRTWPISSSSLVTWMPVTRVMSPAAKKLQPWPTRLRRGKPSSDLGPRTSDLGPRFECFSRYNDGFPLSREDHPVLMQYDLAQLGRHGRAEEHLDRTFDASAFGTPGEPEEYRVAAPVHLLLDIYKERDALKVTGRVETRLGLECGRCLEPFEIPIGSAFELHYVPQTDNSGEGERQIDEDDLTTAFYRDNTLDLGELMREQFQLALPMKPLCADDCKGLCADCGANLNTTTCGCTPKWEDPRLVALKTLLNRDKEIS